MFTNRTVAGAEILGALICCSGCQLFVEGGRRHPRRGSFGCVSTALDKTTVCFFCGTGVFFVRHFAFSMRCSFERCALPQRQISNVGMFFFFFFLLFPLTTADSSMRTLTVIVGEKCCNVSTQVLAVLRVGLPPDIRKHPNAIQKKEDSIWQDGCTADNAQKAGTKKTEPYFSTENCQKLHGSEERQRVGRSASD